MKGITLIWVDREADSTDDGKRTKELLHGICNSVHVFQQPSVSLHYIASIPEAEILLVVSCMFSNSLLPEVNRLPQIKSIFVFCAKPQTYDHHMKHDELLISVYADQMSLIDSILLRADIIAKRAAVFTFFNQTQRSTRNLTREAASFLWYQLLTRIVLMMPHTEESKADMLNHCSIFSQNNKTTLEDIEKFNSSYESDDAIVWYQKDSFLYNLLNRALRTEDAEALYIFRYYVRDLTNHLKREHAKLKETTKEMTVYRGQQMHEAEVSQMAANIGCLVCMNGYLSTSTDPAVALLFAQSSHPPPMVDVLIKINVSTDLNDTIFADLSLPGYPDYEQEVLFDIGSTFELKSVGYDTARSIRVVEMTATDGGREMLDTYNDLMQKELDTTTHLVLFGQLLLEMGSYAMARNYFLNLTKKLTEKHEDMGDIYYNLARACCFLRTDTNSQIVLDYFKKAYELQKKRRGYHTDLVRTLNGMGWLLQTEQSYSDARYQYKEAERLWKTHLNVDHPAIAETYSYLGQHYLELARYLDALLQYERALEIQRKLYPPTHSRIASTLNNLGDVYRKSHQFDRALDHYTEAYAIYQKTLPNNHLSLAYCLSCIGLINQQRGEIALGRQNHERANEMYRRTLPTEHVNIETSRHNAVCTDYDLTVDSYIKPLYF